MLRLVKVLNGNLQYEVVSLKPDTSVTVLPGSALLLVDGVLIMCCPSRTHFRPIQSTSRNLAEAGATVLGVVVNDVETGSMGNAFSIHGSYGYGYRKYGYSPYVQTSAESREAAERKSAEAASTVTDEE